MNRIETPIFLTCLTILLVAICNAIGGQSGMIISILIAGGINLFSFWHSDRIILEAHTTKEAGLLWHGRTYITSAKHMERQISRIVHLATLQT